MPKTIVFDPTVADKQSRVRGVGRYLQILKENFADEFVFTDKLGDEQTAVFVNPFFNLLQTPITMKKIAPKQIAVIHDLIPLKYPSHFPVGIRGKLNIFLNKLALKNYDLVVTDSQASKKDIVQILHINENNIKVIYPTLPKIFLNSKQYRMTAIENSHSSESWNLSDGFRIKSGMTTFSKLDIRNSKYCLYVGDATWNKNLVNLARAIKKINVTCVFTGKIFSYPLKDNSGQVPLINHPWQQELKQFYDETKDDRRFIFLGYVPDEQLITLYQNARCNILISRDEGFGFSYLEASSQSCPTVLSDIPVFKELAGESPLFVDPDSPDAIADKIKAICSNEDLWNKLGIQAKDRSEFFSRKKFQSGWFDIIS